MIPIILPVFFAAALTSLQPAPAQPPKPADPPAAQPANPATPGAAPAGQPATPAKPASPPSNGPARPTDPNVDKIISDLEKAGSGHRTVEPSGPKSSSAPAAAGAQRQANAARPRLLPEDTFLVERRGRVVKSAAGEWLFVFDNDARGPADPPMVLMPCQRLMAIERVAEQRGDAVTFAITGRVFVYHDRNYLLPDYHTVLHRDPTITPAQ